MTSCEYCGRLDQRCRNLADMRLSGEQGDEVCARRLTERLTRWTLAAAAVPLPVRRWMLGADRVGFWSLG